MSFFSNIARDRYAKKLGRALLDCFIRDEFPMELLQDERIDQLYTDFQQYKIDHDETLDVIESMERMLDVRKAYLKRRGEFHSPDEK